MSAPETSAAWGRGCGCISGATPLRARSSSHKAASAFALTGAGPVTRPRSDRAQARRHLQQSWAKRAGVAQGVRRMAEAARRAALSEPWQRKRRRVRKRFTASKRRSPPPDYEVALQSRIDVFDAPDAVKVARQASEPGTKQRAVAIDYPRSWWRIGGGPSAGCNRADGIGASGCWTPGADGPHSPPLDSRCSALGWSG